MAFIKPTVADFKSYFPRDFKYLPNPWNSFLTYNIADQVYYSVTQLYYQCLNNSVVSVPTTTTDWKVLTINVLDYVQDTDISKAFGEVDISLNLNIFGDQNTYSIAYEYFAAHKLCLNLKNEKKGLNSSYTWLLNSQAVADISGSYSIPQNLLNSILFSSYAQTYYGIRYLEIVYPLLRARANFVVRGTTLP